MTSEQTTDNTCQGGEGDPQHLERMLRERGGAKKFNKWRVTFNVLTPNLSGADLSCLDLRIANLNGANLSKANLSRAILAGGRLIAANLMNCDLRFACLCGANLHEVEGLNTAYVLGACGLEGSVLTESERENYIKIKNEHDQIMVLLQERGLDLELTLNQATKEKVFSLVVRKDKRGKRQLRERAVNELPEFLVRFGKLFLAQDRSNPGRKDCQRVASQEMLELYGHEKSIVELMAQMQHRTKGLFNTAGSLIRLFRLLSDKTEIDEHRQVAEHVIDRLSK